MRKQLLLFLLLGFTFFQSQIFVTVNGAGNGSGSSWGNASTLQNAVSSANSNSQLWIKKGVYNVSSTLAVAIGVSNLKLYGGFFGNETALSQRNYLTNLTILDGQTTTQILIIRGASVEVNGITFRNGFVTGTIVGGTNPNSGGGAIRVYGASSVLKNCKFLSNVSTSERGAGAVFFWYGNNHIVDNCEFINNTDNGVNAVGGGGAIHTWDNSVQIINSKFTNNTSINAGGAVYGNFYNLVISNCEFVNNSAPSGGAISGSFLGTRISNSIFKTNHATTGGAFSSSGTSYITNSLFYQNSATNVGGAIFNSRELSVANCTFVANQNTALAFSRSATDQYTIHSTNIFNSIFYNNTATNGRLKDADSDYSNDLSDKDFRRNIFQENTFGPTNLLAVNPYFQSLATGNFSIQSISPAYGYGNNALYNLVSTTTVGASHDLDGNPRLFGTNIDLGAYELQEALSVNEVVKEKLSIYPNPVVDQLYLNGISSHARYKILDLSGKILSKSEVKDSKLSLKYLPKGIYLIQIEDGADVYSKKIIKN